LLACSDHSKTEPVSLWLRCVYTSLLSLNQEYIYKMGLKNGANCKQTTN
jgi:hypothetical protein